MFYYQVDNDPPSGHFEHIEDVLSAARKARNGRRKVVVYRVEDGAKMADIVRAIRVPMPIAWAAKTKRKGG